MIAEGEEQEFENARRKTEGEEDLRLKSRRLAAYRI